MAEPVTAHPSFGRGATWTMMSQVVIFVTTTAGSILLARVLGPGGKGIVGLVNLVATVMFLFGSAGISLSNIYLTGRGRFSIAQLASSSSLAAVTLGPVVFVLMVAAYPLLRDNALRDVEIGYLVLAGAVVPLTILTNSIYSILFGQQRFRLASLVSMTMRIADLALLVVLLMAFKLGIWGAVIAFTARPVLALFVYLWALSLSPRALIPRYEATVVRESVGYGLRVQAGQILEFSNYRLVMFLVNLFRGNAAVGVYGTAVAVAEMMWYLPNAVGSVLLPRTAASQEAEADRFTPLVCRQALLLMVVAAVPLYLAASVLIPVLYGQKFAGSVPALGWLLPGVVALGLAKVLSTDLAGRGHPEYNSYVLSGALAVSLALDLLLIPRPGYYGGINGAAISSSISYICAAVAMLVFFLRVSRASLAETIVPRRTDLAAYKRLLGSLLGRPTPPTALGTEGPAC